jgi:hypothetical protein
MKRGDWRGLFPGMYRPRQTPPDPFYATVVMEHRWEVLPLTVGTIREERMDNAHRWVPYLSRAGFTKLVSDLKHARFDVIVTEVTGNAIVCCFTGVDDTRALQEIRNLVNQAHIPHHPLGP